MRRDLGTCDQGCMLITHFEVPKSRQAYRPLPLPMECLNCAASAQSARSGISPGEGGSATAACFASQDLQDVRAPSLFHTSHFINCLQDRSATDQGLGQILPLPFSAAAAAAFVGTILIATLRRSCKDHPLAVLCPTQLRTWLARFTQRLRARR